MQAISHLCLEKKLWKKTQSVMQVWMGKVCDQTRMAHAERGTACTKNVPTPPVTPAKHKKPLLGGLLQLFCIFPGPLLLYGGGGVGGEWGGVEGSAL